MSTNRPTVPLPGERERFKNYLADPRLATAIIEADGADAPLAKSALVEWLRRRAIREREVKNMAAWARHSLTRGAKRQKRLRKP